VNERGIGGRHGPLTEVSLGEELPCSRGRPETDASAGPNSVSVRQGETMQAFPGPQKAEFEQYTSWHVHSILPSNDGMFSLATQTLLCLSSMSIQ
jgi:hypothetical protein